MYLPSQPRQPLSPFHQLLEGFSPPTNSMDIVRKLQQNSFGLSLEVREPTAEDSTRALIMMMKDLHVDADAENKSASIVESLGEEETQQLLSRLPNIAVEFDDQKDFFVREKSLKAPSTAEISNVPFPPDINLDKPQELIEEEATILQSDLTIVRYTPEGVLDRSVPSITINFSQPMVPISGISDVEDQIPVHISPLPKKGGKFKWLGSTTLTYEANYRFDMSTKYTVTVKKGIKSNHGALLKEDFSFSFETPRLNEIFFLPNVNYTHPLNEIPIYYSEFDQEIDPKEVIKFITINNRQATLIHDGKSSNPFLREHILKMLNDYGLKKKDELVYNQYKQKLDLSPENRHLWFTTDERVSSTAQLNINKGVTGTEGPLPLTNGIVHILNNYPSFHYVSQSGGKVPMDSLIIQFSNKIDLEKLTQNMVIVSPPIERMELHPHGNTISISGNIKGRTTYKVFVQNLVDVWGQTLEKASVVEFNVKSAQQSLQVFKSGVIVIDPTLNPVPTFPIITVNLKAVRCRIHQVTPLMMSNSVLAVVEDKKYPGKLVFDGIISTEGHIDEPVETEINLQQYLQFPSENLGQLLVVVEPDAKHWNLNYKSGYSAWIQSTRISIDCVIDDQTSTAYYWVNSLLDGSIIKDNVKFQFNNSYSLSSPDPNTGIGILKLNLNMPTALLAVASHGNDTCFIPDIYHHSKDYRSKTVAHLFNDRGLYKVGETVSIKGYIRKFELNRTLISVQISKTLSSSVFYVQDARNQKYHSGTVHFSPNGTFNLQFKIPDNVSLGNHTISFTDFSTNHTFKVEEFRTPEFKSSSSIPVGNYIVGGSTVCTTKSDYYSGGSISNAKCNYVIKQTPSSYTPPNQSSYKFCESATFDMSFLGGNYTSTSFSGVTDENGEHQIAIAFKESNRLKKTPITISVEASVQDLNRQTVSSTTSFLVHHCKYYCGIKLNKPFAKTNIPVTATMIVTNIDGNLVSGIPIKLIVTTQINTVKGYQSTSETIEVVDKVLMSEVEPIELPVKFEKGGLYDFSIEIVDSETGQRNNASTSLFVIGGSFSNSLDFNGKNIRKGTLTLLADKKEYEIGDIAKILIQSPFQTNSEGIVFTALHGISSQQPIIIDGNLGCTEVGIEITADHIPNFEVFAEVTGCEPRVDSIGNVQDLPNQPAFASGSCRISVSKISRTLSVESKPESEYLTPGSETSISVSVKDSVTGIPVEGCEVCIVAVDEAVLSITGHKIINPLQYFCLDYQSTHQSYSLRNRIFVKNYENIHFDQVLNVYLSQSMHHCHSHLHMTQFNSGLSSLQPTMQNSQPYCMQMQTPQMNMLCLSAFTETSQPPILLRSNFNPLAIFSPTNETNSQGLATVRFKIPDNLTKYRITAVAVKGNCNFGIHESSMTAQLPLSIRPSLPSFLNFGDKAEFTCVLQNQTQISLEVNAAINFTNLFLLDNSKRGLKIRIPPLGRIELRFPMSTNRVGIARFQVGVTIANRGINFSDAVEKEIRVFTPATTEAFATYGEMDGNISVFQPVKPPQNGFSQFGGLKITTSSTALSSLTDSFLYLYNYPYESCELISSRLLSIIALKDVLLDFKLDQIPSKSTIELKIQKDLSTLVSKQHANGGFGYWSITSPICPFVTCHVAHTFARAKMAGFPLDQYAISKLVPVLNNIENYCENQYSEEVIKSLKAYAYYVLALLGNYESKTLAEKLYQTYKLKGNFEYLAWLATALYFFNNKRATTESNEIITHLNKHVNETAQTANFITYYSDIVATKHVMLHSNRRTDALCLEALIHITPHNHLIPKIVKGLQAHKTKGRWANTQENIFILLALNTYFKVFEGLTPDFVVNMWLGEDYCGEQVFKGRSNNENQLNLPMSLLDKTQKTLSITKEGPGRLYCRIGMEYAPLNLLLDALNYGFELKRTFEHVTDPSHVTFDKEKNTWRFKAGELIRVKLTLTNLSCRYHVALIDYLPAGLESVNPELKGAPKETMTFKYWWNAQWYDHYNMRDERVDVFTSLLWAGTYQFNYLARATSIGSFVIPGVKAEEIYSPEIFGRTSTEFCEVVE